MTHGLKVIHVSTQPFGDGVALNKEQLTDSGSFSLMDDVFCRQCGVNPDHGPPQGQDGKVKQEPFGTGVCTNGHLDALSNPKRIEPDNHLRNLALNLSPCGVVPFKPSGVS